MSRALLVKAVLKRLGMLTGAAAATVGISASDEITKFIADTTRKATRGTAEFAEDAIAEKARVFAAKAVE